MLSPTARALAALRAVTAARSALVRAQDAFNALDLTGVDVDTLLDAMTGVRA